MTQPNKHTWAGADYPDFFAPRDGGRDTLGGFWRLQDQVEERLIEAVAATAKSSTGTLALGIAAYLLRGMVVLSHDHPALTAMGGGALCDGSVLLLHRGLVEALNNASTLAQRNGGPNSEYDYLVCFMAQAALANARKALGITQESAEKREKDDIACFHDPMAKTPLPPNLGIERQLRFVAPDDIYRAMREVFQQNIVADEICGRVNGETQDKIQRRTLCRIAHAVMRAMDEESGRSSTASPDRDPTLPRPVGLLEQFHDAVATIEETTGSLHYQPMNREEIAHIQKRPGADATYSQHIMVDVPALQGHDQAGLEHVARSISQHAPMSVWPIAARSVRLLHLEQGGQKYTYQRFTSLLNSFLKACEGNNSLTKEAMDLLVNSASGAGGIGALHQRGSGKLSSLAKRDITAYSLMGLDALEQQPNILNSISSGEELVALFQGVGDALSIKGGEQLRKKVVEKVAEHGHTDFTETIMAYAHPTVAQYHYHSLPQDERSGALLHAAKNRHAMTLLPSLLDAGPVDANIKTRTGQTSAHLLLEHVAARHSQEVQAVLIALLERGLDPMATDDDGWRAGQGVGDRSHLVPVDTLDRAVSQWEQGVLAHDVEETQHSRRRRTRL